MLQQRFNSTRSWKSLFLILGFVCLLNPLHADRLAIQDDGTIIIGPPSNKLAVLSNGPGNAEDWAVGYPVSGLYDFIPPTTTFNLLQGSPVRALSALIKPADSTGHPVFAPPGGGIFHVDRTLGSTYVSDLAPVAVATGDVDDDGIDEVVASVAGIGVFKVDLDLGTSTLISTNGTIKDLEVGKTAADGKPGVFMVTETGFVIFLNPRTGLQFPFADIDATSLRIGDLDQDGDTEIVVITESGYLMVLTDDGIAVQVSPENGSLQYVGSFVTFTVDPPPDDPPFQQFLRMDVNDDARIDIADPIGILQEVFQGIQALAPCEDARDVNDDGRKDISDVVYALSYLFRGASPPPAPFPNPGFDPTPDGLTPCLE